MSAKVVRAAAKNAASVRKRTAPHDHAAALPARRPGRDDDLDGRPAARARLRAGVDDDHGRSVAVTRSDGSGPHWSTTSAADPYP